MPATVPDHSESDEDDAAQWWNEMYEGETAPPWDIDEPQPALVEVAREEGLSGRVLDVGCGTGAHALWAAERGHAATGIDVSAEGIRQARAKARERDLDVAFRVGNALDLSDDVGGFETVLDSGLFHAFEAEKRDAYADELAGVVSSDGRVFLVGFADGAPDDWGPNPLTPDDVRSAFGADWRVGEIRETSFETREATVPGLLAAVDRV